MHNVESILGKIKLFNGAGQLTCEPLNGGYSNHTYKVTADGKNYVLRVNGGQNSFLKLSRAGEISALQQASGCAPKVYGDENFEEYLVTEFCPGHLVTREEAHTPEIILEYTGLLKRIHSIQGVSRECSPFYLIRSYMEGAAHHKVVIPDGFMEYFKKADEIERQSASTSQYTKRYCHNDIYNINTLNDNGTLTAIDWELSGVGDIFFDLATISYSNNYSPEEDGLLLQGYFGTIEPEHRIYLHSMKYMNMLRDITWGLLHSAINQSAVNHNFDNYGFAVGMFERLKAGLVTMHD